MTAFFQSLGLSYEWAWTVATVAAIIIVSLLVMFSVAMVIYVDRKVLGAIMLRRGPNVVGPFGLLQSFADGGCDDEVMDRPHRSGRSLCGARGLVVCC